MDTLEPNVGFGFLPIFVTEADIRNLPYQLSYTRSKSQNVSDGTIEIIMKQINQVSLEN